MGAPEPLTDADGSQNGGCRGWLPTLDLGRPSFRASIVRAEGGGGLCGLAAPLSRGFFAGGMAGDSFRLRFTGTEVAVGVVTDCGPDST